MTFFSRCKTISSEHVACGLLALWCLLPFAMCFVCLGLALDDGFVLQLEPIAYGPLYARTIGAYRRLFLALGSATMIFALYLVATRWGNIVRRSSMRRQPWLYLLLALLAWSLVSTAFSARQPYQLAGSQYRCEGLYSYFIYAALFCCALRVQSQRAKRNLCVLFTAVVDVLCLVMVAQAFGIAPFTQVFEAPYAAVFNQFNHFGYVLCMAALAAAGLFLYSRSARAKIPHLASFALLVFTLLVNDTFGCYLAVMAGLVAILAFWLARGNRLNLIALAPLAVFCALSALSYAGLFTPLRASGVGTNFSQLMFDLAAVSEGSSSALYAGTGRMRLWVEALNMIPDRPLVGFGPEGLIGAYSDLLGTDRPHNELIQYAVLLGIPALILYVAALLSLAVHQFRNLKRLSAVTVIALGVVVGYVASSLFGNTMFNTAPYFWIALAFAACPPDPDDALFAVPAPCLPLVQAHTFSRPVRIVCAVGLALLALEIMSLGFTL